MCQTAVAFMVLDDPLDPSVEKTEKFETGYITPHQVVMLPETDVFRELDIERTVQMSKVL